MTSIDDMAAEIMRGLTEYADLADTAMKAAVKKTATSVKKEISANAPKRSGKYRKSWTTKKTKENSHTLEMTVHLKDRYQLAHLLEKVMQSGTADVYPASRISPLRKRTARKCSRSLSRRRCHDL